MKQITVDTNGYYIDGERQFLISGEFHYFRVPHEAWRERLTLLKEQGANCVATYIPWNVHEPSEGEYRFDEGTYRDLEGFLRLCEELDMFIICRPGPYVYTEMKMGGLPIWLNETYPDIEAQDIHGTRKGGASYMHPTFLEKARLWYAQVCPIIARHTVSRGGKVAYVQLDNELRAHPPVGDCDYNPTSMGLHQEDGRYAKFLKRRYADIGQVNVAYGTDYTCFAEIEPLSYRDAKDYKNLRRANEYWDFYYDTMGEYMYTLGQYARENGIDCPFVHNSATPSQTACFKQTVERMGEDFLLGCDHYYNLDMFWPQNNPTPQYALRILTSNELLRMYGYPPTIYEMPSGSLADWPPITAHDSKACYLVNLALGAKGINYYIFAGGKNPGDGDRSFGTTGDIYDFSAPISPTGEVRPLYYAQKDTNDFLEKNMWLADAETECDFRVGLVWDYATRLCYLPDGMFELSGSNAWWLLQHGVLATAMCSTYMPAYADLEKGTLLQQTDKPLVVVSGDYMPRAVQENLIRFVQNGGKLLVCPTLPTMDENLTPCTLLKDFIGCGDIHPVPRSFYELRVGDIKNVYVNEGEFVCEKAPEDATVFAVEEEDGSTLGFKKAFENGGTVMWFGLKWHHSNHEHAQVFRYLMEELSCDGPTVTLSNPNVWAVVRSSGDKRMLFLMSLYSAPMETEVSVKTEDGVRDLGVQALGPMEVRCITV